MLYYATLYICTALIFLALDFIWLGFIANNFYMNALGDLMKEEVDFKIAAGFYLMYAVGIVIFAVHPALASNEWKHALIYGALFGFFCYATYDMTNMATLKNWPTQVSIVDMAWGTFVTAFSATSGFFVSRYVVNNFIS